MEIVRYNYTDNELVVRVDKRIERKISEERFIELCGRTIETEVYKKAEDPRGENKSDTPQYLQGQCENPEWPIEAVSKMIQDGELRYEEFSWISSDWRSDLSVEDCIQRAIEKLTDIMEEGNQMEWEDIQDHFGDAINYMAFAYYKHLEEKHS